MFVGLFGVDVSRQPESRTHVDAPAIEMEIEFRAGIDLVAAVEPDNVVVLILNPDASDKKWPLHVWARHHVKYQRADFAQELLAERLQFVVGIVKVMAQENQFHEAARHVLHGKNVVEMRQEVAK